LEVPPSVWYVPSRLDDVIFDNACVVLVRDWGIFNAFFCSIGFTERQLDPSEDVTLPKAYNLGMVRMTHSVTSQSTFGNSSPSAVVFPD
jgi:hypothetical protein